MLTPVLKRWCLINRSEAFPAGVGFQIAAKQRRRERPASRCGGTLRAGVFSLCGLPFRAAFHEALSSTPLVASEVAEEIPRAPVQGLHCDGVTYSGEREATAAPMPKKHLHHHDVYSGSHLLTINGWVSLVRTMRI